jgi:hypothetical protein
MAQWVPFSRARVPFHLTCRCPATTRQACVQANRRVTEIWTYRPAADRFDLVRMLHDPAAATAGAAVAGVDSAGPPPKPVAPPPPAPPVPPVKPLPVKAAPARCQPPASAERKPAPAAEARAPARETRGCRRGTRASSREARLHCAESGASRNPWPPSRRQRRSGKRLREARRGQSRGRQTGAQGGPGPETCRASASHTQEREEADRRRHIRAEEIGRRAVHPFFQDKRGSRPPS